MAHESIASVESGVRDFHFTHQDFLRVKRMIYEHAGINLNDSKEQMVYSRLARRLRALGMERFEQYLDLLKHPEHSEWEHFVNALTTNLTSFFREAHHFDILQNEFVIFLRNLKEINKIFNILGCPSKEEWPDGYKLGSSIGIELSKMNGQRL